MSHALAFFAGWVFGGMSLAFALGAFFSWVEGADDVKPPLGVVDPETGAVWTEVRRLDVRA